MGVVRYIINLLTGLGIVHKSDTGIVCKFCGAKYDLLPKSGYIHCPN